MLHLTNHTTLGHVISDFLVLMIKLISSVSADLPIFWPEILNFQNFSWFKLLCSGNEMEVVLICITEF